MTKREMENKMWQYRSTECKKKSDKTIKLLQKLNKKDNGFVSTRDSIVIAYRILLINDIDRVKTTKSGHIDLQELIENLFEPEEEEIND